jgi:hypothetical protein
VAALKPIFFSTNTDQPATCLLGAWLSLLCGSLKQSDWAGPEGVLLPIAYASNDVLARALLLRRNQEPLPRAALKPVMRAMIAADTSVGNYLLTKLQQPEVNISQLDQAASAIEECVQLWIDGDKDWDAQDAFARAVETVELSDASVGHAQKYGHIRLLLGQMGFVEDAAGKFKVKPISAYSATEVTITKCFLSTMVATSKRAQHRGTVCVERLQTGLATAVNNTGDNMSAFTAGSSQPANLNRSARKEDKFTRALSVRNALFANTLTSVDENECQEFMDVTELQRREELVIQMDHGSRACVAMAIADKISKRKEHIVFGTGERGQTCFIPSLMCNGEVAVVAATNIMNQFKFEPECDRDAEAKALIQHTQIGAKAGSHAENGYFYVGATDITAGCQGLLPGLVVQDDKDADATTAAAGFACHAHSSLYRKQFLHELDAMRNIAPVESMVLPNTLDDTDLHVWLCTLPEEAAEKFLSCMRLCVNEGATAAESIQTQREHVRSNQEKGIDEYQSRTKLDENRHSSSPGNSISHVALVETCGVIRPSLTSGEFRVVVMQKYLEDDNEFVTVRTGPWHELCNNKMKSIRIVSKCLEVFDDSDVDATDAGLQLDCNRVGDTCMQRAAAFLASGWAHEPHILLKSIGSMLIEEFAGMFENHSGVWLEEASTGAEDKRIQSYFRMTEEDFKAEYPSKFLAQPNEGDSGQFACKQLGCDRMFPNIMARNGHMKIHANAKRTVVLTMRSDIDAIRAEAARLKLNTKGKKQTLLNRINLHHEQATQQAESDSADDRSQSPHKLKKPSSRRKKKPVINSVSNDDDHISNQTAVTRSEGKVSGLQGRQGKVTPKPIKYKELKRQLAAQGAELAKQQEEIKKLKSSPKPAAKAAKPAVKPVVAAKAGAPKSGNDANPGSKEPAKAVAPKTGINAPIMEPKPDTSTDALLNSQQAREYQAREYAAVLASASPETRKQLIEVQSKLQQQRAAQAPPSPAHGMLARLKEELQQQAHQQELQQQAHQQVHQQAGQASPLRPQQIFRPPAQPQQWPQPQQ